MGRLVQPPPPARTLRRHPTRRTRGSPPPSTPGPRRGRNVDELKLRTCRGGSEGLDPRSAHHRLPACHPATTLRSEEPTTRCGASIPAATVASASTRLPRAAHEAGNHALVRGKSPSQWTCRGLSRQRHLSVSSGGGQRGNQLDPQSHLQLRPRPTATWPCRRTSRDVPWLCPAATAEGSTLSSSDGPRVAERARPGAAGTCAQAAQAGGVRRRLVRR